MLQLGLCGSIGYMGDVKSPDLGGDPEGDEAVVTERAGVHEGRVRVLVAALRSGRYAQTTGVLQRLEEYNKKPAGFCCLGVACEVAIDNGLALHKDEGEATSSNYIVRYWTESFSVTCDNPACPGHGAGEAAVSSLLPVAACWFGFGPADVDPLLRVPREVMEQAPAEFAGSWSEEAKYPATTLNDASWTRFTLSMIGDCFEYTFLPQDWEAAHAQG